jgi:hypothetical protein
MDDGADDDIRCLIPTFVVRLKQGGRWLRGYDWLIEEKIKAQARALRDENTAEVITLADHRLKAGKEKW